MATMLPDGRRLGAHLPIGDRMVKTADRAADIGATALQIFGDNPTAWKRRAAPPPDRDAFVARIRDLTATINGLEREIERLVADLAPSLLDLTGCGPLTAAKLVGETAGIGRFRSRAAFARHNGSAPLPVWSGNTERHRLSRTGNRQLNVALHRIAITQLQREGPGRSYLEHRRAQGDTKPEAIRALRRRISDEVFRRMRNDEAVRAASPSGLAAAA